MWRLDSVLRLFASAAIGWMLLAGCSRTEAQDQLPHRLSPVAPIVRAADSTHRVVCYVFPNGSGDCVKF